MGGEGCVAALVCHASLEPVAGLFQPQEEVRLGRQLRSG